MTIDYSWILNFIERCYASSLEDNLWPQILGDFRQSLDCAGATLFFTDRDLKPIDAFLADHVSNEAIAAYQSHYRSLDIRMQRAVPGFLNKIVTDRDLVDEEIVRRHEFYQDFLRPAGHRYVASAMIDLEDGAFAFCSAHRGLDQPHIESDGLEIAALILPHIKRAMQLGRRLTTVTSAGQAALDVLDRLSQAVFFIAGDGRIAWQNGRAGRLLDQRDGFVVSDGELRTLSPVANTDLQRLTSSALQAISHPAERPGGMMAVARPSLKRAYQILIAPLPMTGSLCREAGKLVPGSYAAIFVVDPEDNLAPSTEVLSTFYSLTPAEARFAKALASGCTLKAYAERHRLSIHYVRWLLKQIESKTDTRRIGELTRLLVRQHGLFDAVLRNIKENKN